MSTRQTVVLLLMLLAIALDNCFGAMDRKVIEKGLKTHDRALHIKDGWMRDPYIILAPDGYYYLTGTTPLPNGPRRIDHTYNTGLGRTSIVGYRMSLWRSPDLIHWEDLGAPYSLKDGIWYQQQPDRFNEVDESNWRLWAPSCTSLMANGSLFTQAPPKSPAPISPLPIGIEPDESLLGVSQTTLYLYNIWRLVAISVFPSAPKTETTAKKQIIAIARQRFILIIFFLLSYIVKLAHHTITLFGTLILPVFGKKDTIN